MTTDLATRARLAASALRGSVEGLEPLDHAPEPHRRRGVAVLTAVALVAVAAFAAVRADLGGDGVDVVASGTSEVPRLVPTVLPEGLELNDVVELPLPEPDPNTSLQLYGRGTADDPLAAGDLGVFVSELGTEAPAGGRRAVRVQGRPAVFIEVTVPFPRMLQWTEADGTTFIVGSRSLSDDDLLSLAQGVSATARGAQVRDLPAGYVEIAFQESASIKGMSEMSTGVPRPAYTLSYDGRQQHLRVAVHRSGPEHLAILRWWSDAEPAEVRGHPGFLSSNGGLTVLTWLEGGRVAVTMEAVRFTEEELFAAAESLTPVTEDEWAALQDPDSGTGSTTTVVSDGTLLEGTFDGGTWVLGDGTQPRHEGVVRNPVPADHLCFSASTSWSGVTACGPAPVPDAGLGVVHAFLEPGLPPFVYGRTAPDTAAVYVNGEQAQYLAWSQEWGVFAAPAPDDASEVEVVAHNTDGDVIDRETVVIPAR